MGNDIFYNHLAGFADLKVDTSTSPHKLLGRLAGGEYFEIGKDGEDGADGVNQYLYIAYADDEQGTNFNTTTPSKYISLLQSTEPITELTADMFTTWSKFMGVDGESTYVYVGYAMSEYGVNFSFNADKQHPFVAFITSNKPRSEITESDFAEANFVRYHDTGWDNVSMSDLTDTNVASAEDGNILQYNGTVWGLRKLSTVAYTGTYTDLDGNPPYTSFDTTYLDTEVSEDGESQTVSINVDALQELVNSSIQTVLEYNTDPIESDANYFLNKNKKWVEVSGGGGGGLTSDMFTYPLVYGSGIVSLSMDITDNDSSAVSIGWVKSNCYASQSDVWDAIGLSSSGDAQSFLRQDGQWETISGIVGYVDKTHIDTQIGAYSGGSSTMFYNQSGEWVEVSGGGTSYTFSAPLSVDSNNNVSIDTTGFLTPITKADVDAVIGVSSSGSAVKFYNQQGNFVEVSSGTSYTFISPLKETSGKVTFDDTGFVKSGDLNDYALRSELPTVPTKVSELENDSAFITVSALSGYALKSDIPTKTSQLENNSGFITGITETMVETALGASESGSATKYLNEQGNFVEAGGGDTSLSPAVISFISSDLTDGVLDISYDRFVADSNTPVEVALVDGNGVVRTADSAVTMYWNDTGLHIDLSDCEVTGTWKVCYGIVTGTSADYLMTQEVTSTSTNTEVPTAKAVYDALQTAANSKLTAPATTGTDGQVLTLSSGLPIWATPASGGGAWSVDDLQERIIGTEYTADVDGWLILYVDGTAAATCIPILINGVIVSVVGNYSSNAGYPFGTMLPLYAGQTYKVDYSSYMGSWNVSYYFAPCA